MHHTLVQPFQTSCSMLVAGTLVVANTYVQEGRGFTSFQSGMLSIGYLIAVLAMIRVGEKILQKVGAKKPMLWGTVLTLIGVGVMGLTFLPDVAYTVVVFIGFRFVWFRIRDLCNTIYRYRGIECT